MTVRFGSVEESHEVLLSWVPERIRGWLQCYTTNGGWGSAPSLVDLVCHWLVRTTATERQVSALAFTKAPCFL